MKRSLFAYAVTFWIITALNLAIIAAATESSSLGTEGEEAFLLLDVDGTPVAEHPVEIEFGSELPWRYGVQTFAKINILSDTNGIVRFRLPTGTTQIMLRADSYESIFFSDYEPNKDSATAPLEVQLFPGCTIGGRLVNEQGEPLADATVRLSETWNVHSPGQYFGPPVFTNPYIYRMMEFKTTTDEDGRWECSHFPRNLSRLGLNNHRFDFDRYGGSGSNSNAQGFGIRYEADGYTYGGTGFTTGRYSGSSHPPLAASLLIQSLMDGVETAVLKKADVVRGRVIDEQGEPIEGAVVVLLPDYTGERASQGETDAEGWFRMRATFPITYRGVQLFIGKDGYQTTCYSTRNDEPTPDRNENSLEGITMHPAGDPILIQTLDETGRPIPGVQIGWRPQFAFYSQLAYIPLQEHDCSIAGMTDENGEWIWKNPPHSTVRLSIYNHEYDFGDPLGYGRRSENRRTYTGISKASQIGPPNVCVVDAESEEPLPGCLFYSIWQESRDENVPDSEPAFHESGRWSRIEDFAKGFYQIRLSDHDLDELLRIKRDGYETIDYHVDAELLSTLENDILEIHMSKAGESAIQVVQADGSPAAGAELFLTKDSPDSYFSRHIDPLDWNNYFQSEPLTLSFNRKNVTTSEVFIADSEGCCIIPKPGDRFAIVAWTESGMSSIAGCELEGDDTITVGGATVRGRLTMPDGAPLSDEFVRLAIVPGLQPGEGPRHDCHPTIRFTTITDAEGRFNFGVVPPGKGLVLGGVESETLACPVRSSIQVDSEDLNLTLRPRGLSYVAQVQVPEGYEHLLRYWIRTAQITNPSEEPGPSPWRSPNDTSEEPDPDAKLYGHLARTGLGFRLRSYAQTTLMRDIQFDEDGTLRITAIPPGTWRLQVTLSESYRDRWSDVGTLYKREPWRIDDLSGIPTFNDLLKGTQQNSASSRSAAVAIRRLTCTIEIVVPETANDEFLEPIDLSVLELEPPGLEDAEHSNSGIFGGGSGTTNPF
jgi:hypothetical protein